MPRQRSVEEVTSCMKHCTDISVNDRKNADVKHRITYTYMNMQQQTGCIQACTKMMAHKL